MSIEQENTYADIDISVLVNYLNNMHVENAYKPIDAEIIEKKRSLAWSILIQY